MPGADAPRASRERHHRLAPAIGALCASFITLTVVSGVGHAQGLDGGSYGGGAQAQPLPAPGATRGESATQGAPARVRPVTFALSATETFTTNVNLESDGHSDFITQLTPTLLLQEAGPRLQVHGWIAAPIFLYARTGGQDRVTPEVNVDGRLEAIERALFLEAGARVTQSYLDPFGAASISPANNPQNQYTTQSYRAAAVLQGGGPREVQWRIRDTNLWTVPSNGPVSLANAYSNHLLATASQIVGGRGWAADYEHNDIRSGGQRTELSDLARLRAIARPERELETWLSGGYEDVRFPFSQYSNAIYGAGVTWNPSPLTRLAAQWEHRYFGSSWHVDWRQRSALTIWSLEASRDVTSYPEALASLQPGVVADLLDRLFVSRIPDPLERAGFVRDFIDERGLPASLTSPLTLYSRRVYLQQRARATLGLVGARNAVLFSLYRDRSEPLPLAGLPGSEPDLFGVIAGNTQTGAGVVWTRRLTPVTTLASTVNYSRTTGTDSDAESKRATAQMILSTRMSPYTRVDGGLRYQNLRSNIHNDYNEFAVFVGISHLFY
jgi:uncharacterized protein (PEP-CTERM system associated)